MRKRWRVSFIMTCAYTLCIVQIREIPIRHSFARFGYQLIGNGRWVSLTLRKPKKKGGAKKKQAPQAQAQRRAREDDDEGERDSLSDDEDDHDGEPKVRTGC